MQESHGLRHRTLLPIASNHQIGAHVESHSVA